MKREVLVDRGRGTHLTNHQQSVSIEVILKKGGKSGSGRDKAVVDWWEV